MILTAANLAQALHATTQPIRVLDRENNLVAVISPSDALTLMASKRYEAGGTINRVKYIRESVDCQLDCLDGRAILRWWADQRSHGRRKAA
jgi:hypothetical protein